ncbi:molybdopterin-dependent oxidoreductase [Phycicoccus avicenniae]|uniref:molybdopterin-dependent oxidoreductase n=1 Tax=Phycicoccus avicenniae TaxID=2828860 RepID=UPI0020122ED2|nr:molybdopterin-dependent oxidoreductase [Phycicoccus avicenniae]
MRTAPPRESDFTSRLRSPAVASRVGVALGVCFALAFVTGVVSHWAQAQTWWIPYPTAPAWGYRVTQGLHTLSGIACIPLLLVKLWTVFPRLFQAMARPTTRTGLLQLLERASIAVLVAAAIFQLVTGLANAAQWYPWGFGFIVTHYAMAWVAIGALLVHVAVKLPVIRAALGADVESGALDRPGTAPRSAGLTRRGLLTTTWVAAVVAVLASAGNTVTPLRRVSGLAVRDGEGPQGVPVNKSAESAGVTETARDPGFRFAVVGADRTVELSRAELEAMPQTSATLPIACVEGWSASGEWSGVRVRDLLDLAGVPAGTDVAVQSLQQGGVYTRTTLQGSFADHPDTLLALRLNGEDLDIDHGFPCRVIAPNRPGVLQTKWVRSIEVQA